MTSLSRENLFSSFLADVGMSGASWQLLAGDASFRKYYRVNFKQKNYVLMDAPPPMEDVRPFVKITNTLIDQGFSAPRIIAKDEESGLLLIEDFGDERFTILLQNNSVDEIKLYRAAIDVLLQLHTLPASPLLPAYDSELLTREYRLFQDWYLPLLNISNDISEFDSAIQEVLSYVSNTNSITVLRDYHVDNLMWLPERDGIKKVGLLDFQDAVRGHAAYDLVSLLEDARRDVSPELSSNMVEYYLSHRKELNYDEFLRDYAILGLQRNLKILGIFARLAKRDGKPHYLQHLPRVWKYIESDITHPVLSNIGKMLEQIVPLKLRQLVPNE